MKLTLNKTLKLAIIASLCTAPLMAENTNTGTDTETTTESSVTLPEQADSNTYYNNTDSASNLVYDVESFSNSTLYIEMVKDEVKTVNYLADGSATYYYGNVVINEMWINNGNSEAVKTFTGNILDGDDSSGTGNITFNNWTNSSNNKSCNYTLKFTGDVSNFSGDITSQARTGTPYEGGLNLIFATTSDDSLDAASGTGTISLTGSSSESVTYSYDTGKEVTVANDGITAPIISFEGGATYNVNTDITAAITEANYNTTNYNGVAAVNIKDGSSLSLTDTLTTDGADGAEATTATTDYSITVGDVTVTGGTLTGDSASTGSITTSKISNLDLSNTAIVSTNNDGLTLSDVTVTASTLSLTADADSSGDLTLTLSNVTLDNTKLTLNASSTVIKATNLTVIETVTALTVVDVATPTTFTTLTDTDVSTDTTTGSVVISLDSLSSDLVILDGDFTITLDMSDELYAELDRLINEEYYSFTIAIENIDSSTAESLGDLSVSINGISYDYVAGYGASYDSENGTLSFRLVPEPSTASLSLLALAGLVARRRRKA